ncbi:hypothetical protein [Cognatiyoonia sp. IB215182]|uniref:hypothetical protein n=1 Tax=Cognatiyoonia sp. IB215182 TaxID=3097353 RepID=UPI002A15AB6E|nr:hypothetical protein [Cognatiyoonia sp. IB215182]MDX8354825.1 hypothetical protein [Cognatiyoonia sp. IB215182]
MFAEAFGSRQPSKGLVRRATILSNPRQLSERALQIFELFREFFDKGPLRFQFFVVRFDQSDQACVLLI